MYSQSRGKGSAHTWLPVSDSDSTDIGAISYLVMQTYGYGYCCNFWTVHHWNAALHKGTYALLPPDHFLCTMAATPTLSQDSQTLTHDDKHFQIFNELQEKLQDLDVLMAVKAITEVHKKGQSGMADADRMGGEWFFQD